MSATDECCIGPPCSKCGELTFLDGAVDPETGDLCDECYLKWLEGPRMMRAVKKEQK